MEVLEENGIHHAFDEGLPNPCVIFDEHSRRIGNVDGQRSIGLHGDVFSLPVVKSAVPGAATDLICFGCSVSSSCHSFHFICCFEVCLNGSSRDPPGFVWHNIKFDRPLKVLALNIDQNAEHGFEGEIRP